MPLRFTSHFITLFAAACQFPGSHFPALNHRSLFQFWSRAVRLYGHPAAALVKNEAFAGMSWNDLNRSDHDIVRQPLMTFLVIRHSHQFLGFRKAF